MMLSKARRRQLILSWIGIAFAWSLSVAIGVVMLAEWLAVIVPATTVIALIVTFVITKRIRAHAPRASITVEDLRGIRPTPPRRARRSSPTG
jgi:glycerol uptake facilitator-like aquaporin